MVENRSPRNRSDKTQLGVQVLDELFGGGVPSGSNLLLYGPPMCGKKLLLMNCIFQSLKSEIPSLLVLTDFGYADWKLKMQRLNIDVSPFEKSGVLRVVDCYTKQFEPAVQNSQSVRFANSPSALSSISMLISGAQEEILEHAQTHVLAFHSLSSILEETDSKEAYSFMQFHVGKFRKNGATSLFTLDKGMHTQQQVTTVEHLMDGVVEFESGKISARGLGAKTELREYTIGDNGVELK